MKQKITSIGTLIAGILLAFGPQFLIPVCPTTEKVMKCHWSCQALLVVGAVLALVALLELLSKEHKTRQALSLVGLSLCVAAILIPTIIIGGCANAEMTCQVVTFPITHSLSVAGLILQAVALLSKEK